MPGYGRRMRSLVLPCLVLPGMIAVGCGGGAAEGESGGATTGLSSATEASATEASATMSTSVGSSTGGTGESSESGETGGATSHRVGGWVYGLEGAGLRLVNLGEDPIEIGADGPFSFSFPTPVAEGGAYGVSVDLQPTSPEQLCTVEGGSGTIADADVEDVVVRCRTPIRHVLVIGVDGLGGAYVDGIDTPVIDGLVAGGVATMAMQNALPTMSAPNWMSMIAGSSPEQHGVLSNSWSPGDSEPTPTFFAVVREQRPAAKIGIFHDWGDFDDLVEPGIASHIESPGDEVETTAAAISWMKAELPELLFVHLDHVDHAGHFHGWGGDDYVQAVESADALVGEMLAALDEGGMRPYTAILLSADHGGEGLSHGDDTSQERPIPLVVVRPQGLPVKVERELRIFDIAPTVVGLLGLDPPESWLGRPIVEALVGGVLPDAPIEPADVLEVMEYEWRYDDKGSGALDDVSIWRPLAPPGYVVLGDVAVAGHGPPSFAARVVRDVPGTTVRPLGYERIWDDEGSFGANDVALWSPIPPLGYVCLGSVAVQLYDAEPSTELIRCLHRDLVVRGSMSLLWNDQGSGAWEDAGLWACGVADAGGLPAGTFVSRRHHDDPGSPRCWVLAE